MSPVAKSTKICKLCREPCGRFDDSHIIPVSFYEHGRTRVRAGVILDVGSHSKKSPIGIYSQFLCPDCERCFGEWDDYACRLLRDTQPDEEKMSSGEVSSYYLYREVDYEKLKLFFLSVAWRAHASEQNGNPIFGEFFLNECVAENIRLAILAKQAPKPEVLSIFVGKSTQLISLAFPPPKYVNVGGTEFLKMYMPGYVFLIKLDETPIPPPLFFFLFHPGTGLICWNHDYLANGEASEALRVFLADRERRNSKKR